MGSVGGGGPGLGPALPTCDVSLEHQRSCFEACGSSDPQRPSRITLSASPSLPALTLTHYGGEHQGSSCRKSVMNSKQGRHRGFPPWMKFSRLQEAVLHPFPQQIGPGSSRIKRDSWKNTLAQWALDSLLGCFRGNVSPVLWATVNNDSLFTAAHVPLLISSVWLPRCKKSQLCDIPRHFSFCKAALCRFKSQTT